jgi:alkylation response protein AidB-like acyl-CoA dehydrogenase
MDLHCSIGKAPGTDYFGLREPFTALQNSYLVRTREFVGILLEFHVIRHLADIESIHTFEGTETIQALIVGRDITGVGAFS